MAKEVPNRSSEGVRSQYFPRPDLQQDGWLSVIPRANVPPWHPSPTEERGSFRTPDARIAQRRRLHYAEFSQQPHTAFSPVVTPAIILFPPDDVEGFSGFRSPKRKAWQHYQTPQDNTASDIFQGAPVFDPAVQSWIQDAQFPRKLTRREFDAYPDDDVADDFLLASLAFDPAAQDWGIPSARSTKPHRPFPLDNMDVEWISATFTAAFDPSLYPWRIPSDDRQIRDRSLFHDLEKRPNGGGGSGPPPPPPYDPTQLGWTIDSGIPASRKKPRTWLDALRSNQSFGLVDARDVDPSAEQLQDSFRVRTARGRIVAADALAGWGFVTLPAAFDPTLSPQSFDTRSREQHRKVPQLDQPQAGWITSGLFDPQFLAQSLDLRSNAQHKRVPQLDTLADAWVFTNLPATFDPTLSPQSFDVRSREQHRKVPQLDQPQDAWAFTSLPAAFDPALSPQSLDTRSREQHRKVPQLDQQQDGWITSGLFDPQFQPRWFDERSKAQHKLAPQLDQQQDGWITLNIPPPFDFTLSAYSSDLRDRERLWKLSKFQGAYYYDYANYAWVHDIIPLVDPIIQNLTWRPIFGRRRR